MKTFDIKKESTDHLPHCFIIVCAIPSEKDAKDLEKAIIKGFVNKWQKKLDDPTGERIHIIYWDPSDFVQDAKFSALRKVNNRSEIIIVGHSSPGANEIRSNPIRVYNRETQQYELIPNKFTFFDVGTLLLENIVNPLVIKKRHSIDNKKLLPQKLKIYISSCNSAIPGVVSQDPAEDNRSFCDKLFEFLMNGNRILDCYIVGTNGINFPFPVKSKIGMRELFHLFRNNYAALGTGFHERFFLVSDHKLATLIPRYKTTYSRTTFIASDFVKDKAVNPIKLNPVETKLWLTHRNEMKIVIEATRSIPPWDKVVVAERNRAVLLAVDFLKTQHPDTLIYHHSQLVDLIREKVNAAIYMKRGHLGILSVSLGIRFATDLFGNNACLYRNSLRFT